MSASPETSPAIASPGSNMCNDNWSISRNSPQLDPPLTGTNDSVLSLAMQGDEGTHVRVLSHRYMGSFVDLMVSLDDGQQLH